MFQHVRFSAVAALLGPRFTVLLAVFAYSRRCQAALQHLRNALLAPGLLLALSACGSGGSSGSDPEPNPPAPSTPPTVTLQLSAIEITAGGSSVVTWSSTNADSCLATGDWTGYRSPSGSQEVSPSNPGNYQYRLTCGGTGGESTSSVALRVVTAPAPPSPTLTLQVSPERITAGQSATLSWSSTNAQSCTATDTWTGAQATEGTLSVAQPTAGTYAYTLSCQGAGGVVAQQAVLTVAEPSAPPPAPTMTLTISPARIAVGESATLSWNSTNTTSCAAFGAWLGTRSATDSETVSPTAAGSYTYALECSGTGGSVRVERVLVVVEPAPPPPPPTLTMTLSPPQIDVGDSATLTWSAANTDSCLASGAWSGTKPPSGSMSVSHSEAGTYTYVLECSNASGSVRTPRQLVVQHPLPTVTISVSPGQIEIGQTTGVTWSSTNADRCVASGAWNGNQSTSGSTAVSPPAEGAYTYTLTCTGPGGSKTAETTLGVVAPPPPRPKPTITLSVSPARIMTGTDATVSWTTANGGVCSGSGDTWSGPQPTSGSIVVSPTFAGTHRYTLSCDGNGEPAAKNVDLVVFEPTIIRPAQPSKARIGVPYSQSLSIVNGAGSYSWSIVSGGLPTGLRLSTAGVISGTPTTPGSSSFTVQARNAAGDVAQRILLLAVASTACPEPGPQPAVPAPKSEWQWERVSRPMTSGLPNFIRIDPEDANVQYLATATDLFVSHDAGATWVQKVPGRGVTSIELEPGNSCTAYALVRTSTGAVELSKSTDRGQTWNKVTDAIQGAYSLLISRVRPGLVLISSAIQRNRTLYDGFYRSTDGGATWNFVNVDGGSRGLIFWDIEEGLDGTLYSGAEISDHPQPYLPAFFRSTDGGLTWRDHLGGLTWHVTSIQSDPDKPLMYAMEEAGGLYKSSDAGDTWTFVSHAESTVAFLIHPSRPNEMYASQVVAPSLGHAGGVFSSTNRGVQFQPTGLTSHQTLHGLSFAQGDRLLYTVGRDNWIWRAIIPTQSP